MVQQMLQVLFQQLPPPSRLIIRFPEINKSTSREPAMLSKINSMQVLFGRAPPYPRTLIKQSNAWRRMTGFKKIFWINSQNSAQLCVLEEGWRSCNDRAHWDQCDGYSGQTLWTKKMFQNFSNFLGPNVMDIPVKSCCHEKGCFKTFLSDLASSTPALKKVHLTF